MSDHPKRRHEDTGLLHVYDKYKGPIWAGAVALSFICGVAISADEVIRNSKEVPNLKAHDVKVDRAILTMSALQEEVAREQKEIKKRLNAIEDRQNTNQQQILDKLELLVERGDGPDGAVRAPGR